MRTILTVVLCVAGTAVLRADEDQSMRCLDAAEAARSLIASLGSDNSAEGDAAEAELAGMTSEEIARLLVETFRTTENPEVRMRLGRVLHTDAVAGADAVVFGTVSTLSGTDTVHCWCAWGALDWITVMPAEILKGSEFLDQIRAELRALAADPDTHIHVPMEEIEAGRILLRRDGGQYDAGTQQWVYELPLATSQEGVWLVRRGHESASQALSFTFLPAAEAARVRALLAATAPEAARAPGRAAPEGTCDGDCPAFRMHPQSIDHTAGGTCSACGERGIDVCYRLCGRCAGAQGACPGCGRAKR